MHYKNNSLPSLIISMFLAFFNSASFLNAASINTKTITGYKPNMPGHFIPLPDDLNFADYHYVGTHNSHVYPRFFKTVIQQGIPINEQLDNGIRGFMIDVYPMDEDITNKKVGAGSLVLSHGKPGIMAFSQKGFTNFGIVEYQTLRYELETIISFLQKWPSEIVVIHLEDYSDINQLDKDILDTPGASNILFRPLDWNPFKDIQAGTSKKQVWPTLGWLRKNNKRLMITTDSGHNSTVVWNLENKYFASNVWGSKLGNCFGNPICLDYDPKKICNAHWDWENKSGSTLKFFNNYGEAAVTRALWDTKSDALYDTVKNGMKGCGLELKSYYGDRVGESVNELMSEGKKTVYDYINDLNKEAIDKLAQEAAQAAAEQKAAQEKSQAEYVAQQQAKKAADPQAYNKQQQAQQALSNQSYAAQQAKTNSQSQATLQARMNQMQGK